MKRWYLLYAFFAFVFLHSCQNKSNKEYSIPLSDSTSVSGLTGDSVKLIKTAAINFKVKDIEQSTRAVSELANKYGGMIYQQNYQATEEGRKELKVSDDSLLVISTTTPQADITVRIPSENLEAFLYSVNDIGYFTGNRRLKIDDRSLLYLENSMHQKNTAGNLHKPDTSKSPTSLQKMQVQDEIIDQFIANKSIDADANYSTINLALFQNELVRKETIANYVLADYELPFSLRLENGLDKGWEFFLNVFLVVAHLWVFILLGVAALALYKVYRIKRKLAN